MTYEEFLRRFYPSLKVLQLLKTFHIRDDDLFVIAYPRSGTNWLKEIVSCIYLDGDTEKAAALHIQARVPYIEPYLAEDGTCVSVSLAKSNPQTNQEETKIYEKEYIEELVNLSSPRVFSSHIRLSDLPQEVQQGKCKIVMILRNPKDVAVSHFCYDCDHVDLFPEYGPKLEWNSLINDFTEDTDLPHGRWVDYVLEYWNARNTINIKFVKYEDAQKDLGAFIREVAEFIGKPLPNEAIEKIKAHVVYEHMKTNPNIDPLMFFKIPHEKSFYMRKGIVGDWKNYFTVAQSEAFDKVYHQNMNETDIKMQFEL